MMRLALLAIALQFIAPAQADDWPRHKPIHFIVAFAPGSTPDIVGRLVAPRLSQATGQSVVVENRPGAGGNVGAQQVKRAAPDGYTLLVTSVALVVNVALYGNPGYDLGDFSPVILAPSMPSLIAVTPSLPVRTLQDLVRTARMGALSYASSGIGTPPHLSMERLKAAAKIEMTHVPYPAPQAVGAAVAGHTHLSSTAIPPAMAHVRSGRVRPIAVTGAQRSPALPEVPTVNEQGFSGFEDLTWTAFFVRAGTPQDIVSHLNSDINAALSDPAVQQRLLKHGLEWKGNTPGEFAAFLRSEEPKWAKAVRDSGARAD